MRDGIESKRKVYDFVMLAFHFEVREMSKISDMLLSKESFQFKNLELHVYSFLSSMYFYTVPSKWKSV